MQYPPPGSGGALTDLPHKGGGGGSRFVRIAAMSGDAITLTSPLVGEVAAVNGVNPAGGGSSGTNPHFAGLLPFGMGNTSSTFSFGSLANGLYSGSPTRVVIQLVSRVVRA